MTCVTCASYQNLNRLRARSWRVSPVWLSAVLFPSHDSKRVLGDKKKLIDAHNGKNGALGARPSALLALPLVT